MDFLGAALDISICLISLIPTSVFVYNMLSVVVVYNHDLIKVIVVVLDKTSLQIKSRMCLSLISYNIRNIYQNISIASIYL